MKGKAQIESDWGILFGDRKIELVFIGQHLSKENIIAELEDCVLTDEEIKVWKNQEFPKVDAWPIPNYEASNI